METTIQTQVREMHGGVISRKGLNRIKYLFNGRDAPDDERIYVDIDDKGKIFYALSDWGVPASMGDRARLSIESIKVLREFYRRN